MSNTRHADNPEAFSQERYASSAEFDNGLLANLVARRCDQSALSPDDRDFIFWIQALSHRPGALAQLAKDILALRGSNPNSATWKDLCELEQHALSRLCLDPSERIDTRTGKALRQFQAAQRQRALSGIAQTQISRTTFDTLDYALEQSCLVLLEGNPRIGKSKSAKTWCEANLGRARYMQVPSTSDDAGFFRAIAEAIGTSCATSLKTPQIRDRIERALQTSKLMLVMDEAHYLLPQRNRREGLPGRINWIMTAFVNYDVPVALVCTPQFSKDQRLIEQNTGWSSGQFIGRIGLYEKLPDTLSEDELAAVVRCHLPAADAKSIRALVFIAQSSKGYCARIEHAAKRAAFLAQKSGRTQVTFEDIKAAIETHVAPSDLALRQAQEPQPSHRRRRALDPAPRSTSPVKISGANSNGSEPDLCVTRQLVT
jgi:hypothetical protein